MESSSHVLPCANTSRLSQAMTGLAAGSISDRLVSDSTVKQQGRASVLPRRDAPGFCVGSPPSQDTERAQGKPGARCTRGLVCNVRKKCAHEHTGSAEAFRLSLRDGFTAYFALSSVNGLSCHRRRRDRLRKLDASVAASGPHDFAVRISRARQSQPSRPPHPTRAFVTCATPLSSGETGGFKSVICPTAKAEYFCSVVWTGVGDLPAGLLCCRRRSRI